MMSEDFQWEDDFQIEELAARFEDMVRNGLDSYFDSEEFEALIDYYQLNFNSDKARQALMVGMKMHPYNNRLKIMSARQMAVDGKYINALNLLDEIETTEPADVDILLTKGSVYSMMLDFSKAVKEYEKALVIVDEDEMEEIFSTIAFEYENMGAFDSALDYLFKALEISEYPEQILFEIGMCYEMASRLEDSVSFFTKYLEEQPSSTASWFNLGLSFHHLELYEKAIDSFEYVIAIDESYIPAYINMAQSYAASGEYHKAIEVYHETEAYEKPESLTLYYIGECYEKLQDYEQALKYYQQAIEVDENLPDAWAGIGIIHDEMGDAEKAIHYVEKAIELDDLNTEFHLIAADLFIKTNRTDKAKEHFQRIEEIDPLDPDLWKEYAYMHILSGENEKAVQVLKTGLIHQPQNASIIYRLVATLILNKNTTQAYYYLETALEIDYKGHEELFEFMPSLRNNQKVNDLINQYLP